MNSKEALERVKTAPEYCGEKSVYKKYDNSYIPFMNDIELIEKDLEVLEIIKKYKDMIIDDIDDEILMEETFIEMDKDFLKESKINEMKQKIKELNELKEWLKNENEN